MINMHVCWVASVMSNSVTLWTVAHQTPLSMEFSRQEDWSGLPFPPAGDLLDPGIEPGSLTSPALLSRFFITATAAAESLQSCPTLCDPIDRSPPGSPVPGILQARTLEWVAISFSLSLVHLRSPSKDGIVVYLGCFYHKWLKTNTFQGVINHMRVEDGSLAWICLECLHYLSNSKKGCTLILYLDEKIKKSLRKALKKHFSLIKVKRK